MKYTVFFIRWLPVAANTFSMAACLVLSVEAVHSSYLLWLQVCESALFMSVVKTFFFIFFIQNFVSCLRWNTANSSYEKMQCIGQCLYSLPLLLWKGSEGSHLLHGEIKVNFSYGKQPEAKHSVRVSDQGIHCCGIWHLWASARGHHKRRASRYFHNNRTQNDFNSKFSIIFIALDVIVAFLYQCTFSQCDTKAWINK